MSDVRPTVLAVVVATDGASTLPRTLASLDEQDHGALEVVAVDNGSSDDSRDILIDHLGPERVLVADRDLGFGGAVGMALDAEIARGAPYIVFVHDDLALRPDAVRRMVDAMEADEQLAAVGCKLVEWDDPRRLQAVGMSVDVTGRADPGVEEDELDQGQRDHERQTLYVSTAGMLVRRDRFEELGRFDHRYHLFRDDLDLCWRAWLRGWSVEVVPTATGVHEASASTYRRLGQTAFLGPRYFAERNTLATLLKNYGFLRLLYVIPLFLAVGVAKVLGFVATRRLGDAWQTLRAWVWNVMHLRETWRLRHRVQMSRQRSDSELAPLFAQVTARLRAYGEAFGELVSGSSDEIGILEDEYRSDEPEPTWGERVVTTVRTSPVGVAAIILLVLGAIVSLPLLDRDPLLGGGLAAWPEGLWTIARGYLEPWSVGDLPAVVEVNPAQVLFTIPTLLAGGSTWAAPKLLVLFLVPVAWASALRAGRLVTHRRLPRVAGATLYALAPPMLAALRTGRIGAALAAALLPLVVIAVGRAVLPGVPADRAWRATAAAALAAGAAIGFEPATGVLLLVAALVAASGIVLSATEEVPERLGRLGLVLLGAALVLAPWFPRLRSAWEPATTADGATLWRLLLLTPDLAGFPGPLVGFGLAAAALLGVALAVTRTGQAAGLAAVYLAGVGLAWAVLLVGGPAGVWPGAPLLVAALAASGLLTMAFTLAEEALAAHGFGWRQVAAFAAAGLVVVGIGAAGLSVGGTAWEGYRTETDTLPAYFASEVDVDGVGPFRVLVLADAGDDAADVRWSVTDADGPTMASWGHVVDAEVDEDLGAAVEALTRGQDPAAGALLGRRGIRYVVVPGAGRSETLDTRLQSQLDLVAQPVADDLVLRVTTWAPRWSVVPTDAAADALTAGSPLPAGQDVVALDEHDGAAGVLVLADPTTATPEWEVVQDGNVIEPTVLDGTARWELDEGEVTVRHTDRIVRRVLVGLQALAVALALSLSLRAPGFARRRATGSAR